MDQKPGIGEYACTQTSERGNRVSLDPESQPDIRLRVARVLNNNAGRVIDSLRGVLTMVREWAGLEAAGLRISEGTAFPYLAQDGQSSGLLCGNNLLPDNPGLCGDKPLQSECLCAIVVAGRTGFGQACFTECGSFWRSSCCDPADSKRQSLGGADCCSRAESMVLVPIRSKREIVGLLQLSDHRKGRLSAESIRILEDLAEQIGIALRCKYAEDALYCSEEQLRLSIEHAPGNIAMFDRQMRYLAASRRWVDSQRLTEEPFIGLELYQLAPQIPERWKEIHKHCLSGGTAKAEEEYSVGPDGLERWWRWETRPWHTASGEVGGIIIFSENITADRKAREAEAREREVLQSVMNGARHTHLVYLDADFNFVLVNEAYAQFCGHKPSEMIGKNHFVLFPHRENEILFRRVRDTGEPAFIHDRPFEYPDHPERGVTYWDCTLIPVKDGAGKVIGLVFSLYETTARKRDEELLRQAKKDLERSVGERTAELSTTVATLRNEVSLRKAAEQELQERSEQLREMAAELTKAEQRERKRLAQVLHDGLQQILVGAKYRLASIKPGEDAKRLASEVVKIIDEAIKTSRSLTAELSPPILHQSGLIAGLKWLVEWMCNEHGLKIELRSAEKVQLPQPELAVFVFQAIRELLFNVIKHSGIRSAGIEIVEQEGCIAVVVEDKGSGFDQTQLRAAGGRTGGFGLFYISERVNMMGGRMSIKTAPGEGSRFEILLPLPSTQTNSSPVPPVGTKPASSDRVSVEKGHSPEDKIRVVLVDDHTVMRQGLSSLLRALPDIEIVGEASDGEAAVDLIRKVRPDVVLMDVSMPVMDGIQATRIVHSELPQVKVIGLSMFQEGEQAAAMREAGATNYISKSGPSDSVIRAIRACVRRASRVPGSCALSP